MALVFPLLAMFSALFSAEIVNTVTSAKFITALLNSLSTSVTATLYSVFIASILAFAVYKTNIKRKNFFIIAFSIPMLIPSISHGAGLIILLGQNGLFTNIFNLNHTIYGFSGIVLASIMYAFPPAFLMIYDILRYEDHLAYEAAEVLGISKTQQFFGITLPYLKKPYISVFFTTFTLIITDYGVPLMVGGKHITLPVMMYQEVIGLLDFSTGSIIGVVLVFPAIVAFLVDHFTKDDKDNSFITKTVENSKNKIRDIFSYIICSFTIIIISLPLIAFVFISLVKKYPIDLSITFINIKKTFELGSGVFLYNSLLIALLTSATGITVSFLTAYLTARIKTKTSYILHLISISSLAIPGIVLGLAYVLFFKGTFIYGSMALLILVNCIHFFATPYLLAYNGFGKININLEAVGATLGIKRYKIIIDVIIPYMLPTILEMFSYFFINSMITISAVSFLATVSNMPLSLLIPKLEAQMLLECYAFISFLLFIINIFIKAVVYFFKPKEIYGEMPKLSWMPIRKTPRKIQCSKY